MMAADIEIYDRVRGMKLERFIATRRQVQTALSFVAQAVANEVDATRSRSTGHSRVFVEGRKVDRYVVLEDDPDRVDDEKLGRRRKRKAKDPGSHGAAYAIAEQTTIMFDIARRHGRLYDKNGKKG